MWNLKINDTMNLLTKQKATHRLRERTHGHQGRGQGGVWDGRAHTAVSKMDNQQRPTVQHVELTWQLGREGSLEENGYLYMDV